MALAIRTYFRTRVNVRDAASVEAWLRLALPRLYRGADTTGNLAVTYANLVRQLELPNVKDGFVFEKAAPKPEALLRASLSVVGPGQLVKELDKLKQLSDDPAVLRPLQADAIEKAADRVAGATVRHVLDSGRDTIDNGVKNDPKALGYIRVTKAKPCYFCAMLASRGITYGPYRGDSFDVSDARFVGEGNVKVHDHDQCSMKPVYTEDDPFLDRSEEWRTMWDSMEHKGGAEDVKQFRQIYEGRA